MEKTLIASGKTIDLAIESALTQLGLDRDSVSVQVIQQAKAGFLGFGAQPAKVQVTYEAPDPVPAVPEKPKSALGSASRSKPKAAAPVKKPEAPKAPEAPKPEKKARFFCPNCGEETIMYPKGNRKNPIEVWGEIWYGQAIENGGYLLRYFRPMLASVPDQDQSYEELYLGEKMRIFRVIYLKIFTRGGG